MGLHRPAHRRSARQPRRRRRHAGHTPQSVDDLDADLAGQYLTDLDQVVRTLNRSADDGLGSGARDWRRFDDRLNLAICPFRSRQTDPSLFWPPYSEQDQKRIVHGELPHGRSLGGVIPPLDAGAVGNFEGGLGDDGTGIMSSAASERLLDLLRQIGDAPPLQEWVEANEPAVRAYLGLPPGAGTGEVPWTTPDAFMAEYAGQVAGRYEDGDMHQRFLERVGHRLDLPLYLDDQLDQDKIESASRLFSRYGTEIGAALLLAALPEAYAASFGSVVLYRVSQLPAPRGTS